MFRTVYVLFAVFFSLIAAAEISAQQSQPMQMASLRPGLVWQRTSPKPGGVEGPVLYQLLFSASGTPGTLAKFDTNPRHLTNSLITDNGSMVAIGALSITSAGLIGFAGGQTFPNTVTSVASGAGLTGGPITTGGTLSLDTNFTNNLYSQLAATNTFSNGQIIRTGASTVGLVVQGANAQTANLEEWRNGAGTAVASISPTGAFTGDGSGLTNLSASQLVNGGLNREQIALLKWYATRPNAYWFSGNRPYAIAFDGGNVWVTNSFDNTVAKLRACDLFFVGQFAVGTSPHGVAFDGINLWVANNGSNNVSKLQGPDGSLLGTFAVGSQPEGVSFDGSNMWVANTGSNNVTKLRVTDGALQGTFAVGTNPHWVAFDGANIWVTNNGSNNVTKLRASDGALLGTFSVGAQPDGIAFDGVNLWVANSGSNNVSKLRASDGALQGTFTVGSAPRGVVFDGANIWVVNSFSSSVTKLRASDGAVQGTFSFNTSTPIGAAFDGANIWVAGWGGNLVSKL
jgi:outer membrane lipoprotein-sorting protein